MAGGAGGQGAFAPIGGGAYVRGGVFAAGGPTLAIEAFIGDAIPGVALQRRVARTGDQAFDGLDRFQVEAPGGGDHVFLEHRAAEVVATEGEGDLRELHALGHVAGLHVLEVVEHDARDGLHAQVFGGGGFARVGVLVGHPLGLGVPAGKGREAAGFVLQIAQADQVLDPLGDRLHVPKHHGGGAAQTRFVDLAMDFEPIVGGGFFRGDDLAHPFHQHLGARAGHRTQARFAQVGDDLRDGALFVAGEVFNFGGRQRVTVDIEARGDVRDQLAPPIRKEVGMVAALHQELAPAQAHGLFHLAVDLVPGEHVAFAVPRTAVEGAESAVGDADVGGVEVAVDDVGDPGLGIQALAHRRGHAAQSQQVRFGVQEEGLVLGQPLPRVDGQLQPVELFPQGAILCLKGRRGPPRASRFQGGGHAGSV